MSRSLGKSAGRQGCLHQVESTQPEMFTVGRRYNRFVNLHPLDLVDEMFDLGVEMRRERARREAPELDEASTNAIVAEWLRLRPNAPIGDSAGTAGTWPRR